MTQDDETRIPEAAVRPTCSVEEAAAWLGISRTSAYSAIRRGDFPIPALHIAGRIMIPTAALRRFLMLDEAS